MMIVYKNKSVSGTKKAGDVAPSNAQERERERERERDCSQTTQSFLSFFLSASLVSASTYISLGFHESQILKSRLSRNRVSVKTR